MGFLKHLFKHKQQDKPTKIYVDETMADEIVNILNEMKKQQ